MTPESRQSEDTLPTPMGSLPSDPTERLQVLERLWATVQKRGLVRAVPCDDDDHEFERSISDSPEEMCCCEGHGWVWEWRK